MVLNLDCILESQGDLKISMPGPHSQRLWLTWPRLGLSLSIWILFENSHRVEDHWSKSLQFSDWPLLKHVKMENPRSLSISIYFFRSKSSRDSTTLSTLNRKQVIKASEWTIKFDVAMSTYIPFRPSFPWVLMRSLFHLISYTVQTKSFLNQQQIRIKQVRSDKKGRAGG